MIGSCYLMHLRYRHTCFTTTVVQDTTTILFRKNLSWSQRNSFYQIRRVSNLAIQHRHENTNASYDQPVNPQWCLSCRIRWYRLADLHLWQRYSRSGDWLSFIDGGGIKRWCCGTRCFGYTSTLGETDFGLRYRRNGSANGECVLMFKRIHTLDRRRGRFRDLIRHLSTLRTLPIF